MSSPKVLIVTLGNGEKLYKVMKDLDSKINKPSYIFL